MLSRRRRNRWLVCARSETATIGHTTPLRTAVLSRFAEDWSGSHEALEAYQDVPRRLKRSSAYLSDGQVAHRERDAQSGCCESR